MTKRKNMGEMRPLFPLIGKTLDEGRAWLNENTVMSPAHDWIRLTMLRGYGGAMTCDLQLARVNVRVAEDGKISSIMDIG